MFGDIQKKLEAHAREKLVDNLSTKGEAHVDKIGTWRYDALTHTVTFEPGPVLLNELQNRIAPAV